jgi:vacuolar-type H+-ATPase subunit I/STV1
MSDASTSQRRACSPPSRSRAAHSAQLAGAQGPVSARAAIAVTLAAMGDVLNRRISPKEATALARLGEAAARLAHMAPEMDATLAPEPEEETETPSCQPTENTQRRELRRRKEKLEAELAALNGEL